MTYKTCRQCDKIEPRGCGKTCCAVDKHVIKDFDAECKFTEEEIYKVENGCDFNCKNTCEGCQNEQNT